ncbi:MAG: hypothetical protein HOY76_14595 [Streptomyces sp.]|nr:hypothetical protein [Streptomyces sp.]
MTSPLRVLRQIVAPNGRHRSTGVLLVDEPGGLAVNSRRVLSEDELLEGWGAPVLAPGAVVATSFDDCVPCGKATAGVLHRNGWTCGECLTSVPAGGIS